MTKKKYIWLTVVLLFGFLLMGVASVAEKKRARVAWDGAPYRLEDVNPLDAQFAHPYNKARDDLGTLFVIVANAAASYMAVMFIFLKEKNKKEAFRMIAFDVCTYGECYLYASSLYRILKICVLRIRPYMYFINPCEKGIAKGDFCLSWPSGHSSGAFVAVGFMFSWFMLRYPNSKVKKPVLCFFFLLGLSTMIMRMLSGNHFLTDVLSGACFGFLASSFVFQVNNAILRR